MIQILVDILDRLRDVLLFFFVFVLLTNYLIDIPFYVSCKLSDRITFQTWLSSCDKYLLDCPH